MELKIIIVYAKKKDLNINKRNGVLFEGWCELERLIKDYKESANLDKINKKLHFSINCSLFQDFFEEEKDINDLLNNYNNELYDDDSELKVKSKKNG